MANWRYWVPSAGQSINDACEILFTDLLNVERAALAGALDWWEQETLRGHDVPLDPPLLITVQKANARHPSGWGKPRTIAVEIVPQPPEFKVVQ